MANIIDKKNSVSLKRSDNFESIDTNDKELKERQYEYHCNWKSCGFNTTNYKLLCEHLEENHIDINDDKEKVLDQKLSQQFDNNIDKSDVIFTNIEESIDLIEENVDYNQENNSVNDKNEESLECNQIGCDYRSQTMSGLRSHNITNDKINDRMDDDFGVEPNRETDEENEEKNELSINDNSYNCTFPDCQYLGQNLLDLRIHLLNKHKIDGKVYVDINNSLKETVEEDMAKDNSECVNKLNKKSGKCYVKDCNYNGHSFHGLRIHLLKKHGIHVNVEKPEPPKTQLILLTKRSFTCTIPNCNYGAKNAHSLRIHYNRRHAMRVRIRTQSSNTKPIIQTIDNSIDHSIQLKETPEEKETESMNPMNKSFKCIETDCDYESTKFNSLRSHIIRKHKYFPVKNDKNNEIEVKNRPEVVQSIERQIFECNQKGCEYVGENALGLRVHMRQKHMIRIRTSLLNATKTITVAQNVDQNVDQNYDRSVDQNNGQNKTFECSIPHCEYIGQTLKGLRIHKRNKHHIKHHFRPFQTAIPRTNEAINKLKRKYARNLNENNINYSMKRKYTFRSNDKNFGPQSAAINNDNNKDPIRVKRKYTRHVDNEGVNQTNPSVRVKRKYTRRVTDNNNQELNAGMQRITHLTNVIKRQYNRPSIAHSIPIAVINPVLPNLKHKFKCQFPKCGFVGINAEQLKGHVQCIHKKNSNFIGSPSNQNLFKCYFPECPFIGYAAQVLRDHISSQHNSGKDVSSYKIFKCKFPNCCFAGSLTLKGLRIHVNRNHKGFTTKGSFKVVNVVNRNSSSSSFRRPVVPQKRNIQSNDQEFQKQNISNRNIMVFKCSFIDCPFTVSNLVDLRKHISAVHQN